MMERDEFIIPLEIHRVAEEFGVVALPKAILSAILLISPSHREIIGGYDLIIDDRSLLQFRPDQLVTTCPENCAQGLDPRGLYSDAVIDPKMRVNNYPHILNLAFDPAPATSKLADPYHLLYKPFRQVQTA